MALFAYPFGFSRVFDGLELFTEPRYIRRTYTPPRPQYLGRWGWSRPTVAVRRAEPALFDLLTFGDEFLNPWDDNSFDEEAPYLLEHGRSPKKARKSLAHKKDERKSAPESPAAIDAAPSAPADAPSTEAPATTSTTVATVPTEKAVAEAPKYRLGHIETEKTDSGLKFAVHLPGLALEDLKLDLDTKHRALTVKADKKTEEKHTDEFGTRTSTRVVSFTRSLPLPSLPAAEDIKADFVDGVLLIEVALPAGEPLPDVTRLHIAAPSAGSHAVEAAPSASAAAPSGSDAAPSDAAPSTSAMDATPTTDASPAAASPAPTETASAPAPEVTVEDAQY